MTTSLKNTGDNLEKLEPLKGEYGYSRQNDEIDLLQLVLNLKQRWKMILTTIVIGTGLSIVFALMIPKTYQGSIIVTLPSSSDVSTINGNGLLQYSKKSLFDLYFGIVRSQEFLKKFIIEEEYLPKLYPSKFSESTVNKDVMFSEFVKTFRVEIHTPFLVDKKDKKPFTYFKLSAQHGNEALLVKLLNHYIEFANKALFTRLKLEHGAVREVEMKGLEQEIELLISSAKTKKELSIAEIEINNAEKLSVLEQQKLVVTTEAEADKMTQIAITQEALTIATSLNIVYPTPLEDLNKDKDENIKNSGENKTDINLNNSQSLPLYLMGSNYLNILIKSLRTRENDEVFLQEINRINSQIEVVKNDMKLASLKARSDETLFQAKYPSLLNSIERLNIKSLNFAKLNAYTVDKSALLTNQAIKPDRPLIVIIGAALSVFFAIVIALYNAAVSARKYKVSAKHRSI